MTELAHMSEIRVDLMKRMQTAENKFNICSLSILFGLILMGICRLTECSEFYLSIYLWGKKAEKMTISTNVVCLEIWKN